MLDHISAGVERNAIDHRLIGRHASMVITQAEQVLKAQNDLLN